MYYSERAVIAMAKRAWTKDFLLCPADHRVMALVARLYRYRGIQVKFRYIGSVPDVPTKMTFYEIVKPKPIGKSSIIKAWAQKNGVPYVDIRSSK